MRKYRRALINRKVIAAINRLVKHDPSLIKNNVNERSISHKLAEYLQEEFQYWHVDCEYNRDHDLRKQLDLPIPNSGPDDTEAKTVFPDIIVHHRDTSDNLLVIEIKKSSNRDNGRVDMLKLAAFVKPPFSYQHGLFIRFTTGEADVSKYKFEWFPQDAKTASAESTLSD